jgi:hypothetical protein
VVIVLLFQFKFDVFSGQRKLALLFPARLAGQREKVAACCFPFEPLKRPFAVGEEKPPASDPGLETSLWWRFVP